jgi:lipopolysaccharide transport system ATP-binding protein
LLTISDEGRKTLARADDIAIAARDLSKSYKLYAGASEQLSDMLGLPRLLTGRRKVIPTHDALKDVSLTIRRGERVGVIGRNGAGKTTLLKLISRAAQPTSGELSVSGEVQALMHVGVGFHPDFTGLENIRSALLFSGLSSEDRAAAEREIIDFVELGQYLEQPIKSYSLGMLSRLQFACATAIKPEILIVDEILGAGDAYFSVKSSVRMERLTKSGCTLILVSHAMAQVLQYCERAIWIDAGRIVRDGPVRPIVTAYEQYMFELSRGLRPEPAGSEVSESEPADTLASLNGSAVAMPAQEQARSVMHIAIDAGTPKAAEEAKSGPPIEVIPEAVPELPEFVEAVVAEAPASAVPEATSPPPADSVVGILKEIPDWYQEQIAAHISGGQADALLQSPPTDKIETEIDERHRWINDPRLKIIGAQLLGPQGPQQSTFFIDEPFVVEISLEAQQDGTYDVWYVALIYMNDGKPMVRHVSEKQIYTLKKGDRRTARIGYDALRLGRGEYHISVAVYRDWHPDDRASAHWYEILNRSLEFQVLDPRPYDPSLFFHPSRWTFPR